MQHPPWQLWNSPGEEFQSIIRSVLTPAFKAGTMGGVEYMRRLAATRGWQMTGVPNCQTSKEDRRNMPFVYDCLQFSWVHRCNIYIYIYIGRLELGWVRFDNTQFTASLRLSPVFPISVQRGKEASWTWHRRSTTASEPRLVNFLEPDLERLKKQNFDWGR